MEKNRKSADLIAKIKKARSPKKMMKILEWADNEDLLEWGYPYCASFDCDSCDGEFCQKMFANIFAPPYPQIFFYKTEETDGRPGPEFIVWLSGKINKNFRITAKDYKIWEKAKKLYDKFSGQANRKC